MTPFLKLRHQILVALGGGALAALAAPQCNYDPETSGNVTPPSYCVATTTECYTLEQLAVFSHANAGESGAAVLGSNGGRNSAGQGGAAGDTSSACPTAEDLRQLPAFNAVGHILLHSSEASNDSLCCYSVATPPLCPGGRPFFVDGEARVAERANHDAWNSSARAQPPSDSALRDGLARAWLADAHAEHASIAAFARLTLDLLALGAPPELVAASQRASLDEIEHARICFALASSHAQTACGPGALRVGSLFGARDLAELAGRAVNEGCVGETIAALVVGEQAQAAVDPELRVSLARIAADEAKHAVLAWQVLSWAIAAGGAEVRVAARAAFERATAETRAGGSLRATSAAWLAQGRLGEAELCRIVQEAYRVVITPCARALV